MQHQEAIRVIRRLGPELTKEAAESVLLRYAEEEDLAPAQLEKLAQAYNMVRQLSHIDASEDRSSSCHQIDTTALSKGYAGVSSTKQAAAPVIVGSPSHDVGDVNLAFELHRELYAVTKAASCDNEGLASTTCISVPPADKESDVRWTPEQLKEAAWEAKVDFYMLADEILKMAKCEGRTLQFAEAEKDASRLANPVCISGSLDWLTKYAAQQKISRLISRHEGPVKSAAFNVTTPLADKLIELADAFTVTSLLYKYAAAEGIKIEDLPAAPFGGGDDWLTKELEAMVPVDPVESPGQQFKPTEGNTRSSDERENETGDGGKSGGGGGGKSKSDTSKATEDGNKSSGKHWLTSIISGATKPLNAAAGVVDSAADRAKGAIKGITEKERVNTNQVKLDGDIADIRRSILIRRLAASDPVLKDLPLRDVLDTYNAIAESNPEAASNPRRVLLAMREAASYEGITLDAQKQLGDIRSVAAKSDEQESNNIKRRYKA